MTPRSSLPVLVVTASQNEAETLNSVLRKAGHAVRPIWVANIEDAEKSLKEQKPDLILCSMSVPGASLAEVVKLRDMTLPNVPIIALAPSAEPKLVAEIVNTGARDLVAANQPDHIQAVVSRELEVLQLARELERASLTLKEYEQRINVVMNESKDAIAHIQEGILLDANPAFLELFGYKASGELEGTPVLEIFDASSLATLKEALKTLVKGQSVASLAVKGKHVSGKPFETKLEFAKVEIEGEPAIEMAIRELGANQVKAQVKATTAKVQAHVTHIHNQTQAQQAQIEQLNQKLAAGVQQLATARNLDMLTGLTNRMHFLELLKQKLSKTDNKMATALVYVRPDHFGQVAEKVGAVTSDGMLKALAELIRSSVHKHDLISRFDGTGFALLLVRGKLKEISDWAEQLHATVAARIFESGGKSTSLTCSIGYAQADEDTHTAERLMDCAMEALRNARKAGGNRAVQWTPPVVDEEGKVTDAEWKRRLTEALKTNRFMLAYQPIASLTGEASGFNDVLVRLQNEQGQEIPIKDFMPAAERLGLMIGIDRWIIERAIKALADHHSKGQEARFFLRLSDQSLTDKTLLPWLEKLLGTIKGLGDGHVVVQIAEKSAEKYITDTRSFARSVRDLKCGFALEHFGVGHNPLHTLDLVQHVDYIKVDGTLTGMLAADERKRNAVKSYIDHARGLNIHTIAEKVEKPETMAVLYQLGIEFIQGNYVQEPEVVMHDSGSAPVAAG